MLNYQRVVATCWNPTNHTMLTTVLNWWTNRISRCHPPDFCFWGTWEQASTKPGSIFFSMAAAAVDWVESEDFHEEKWVRVALYPPKQVDWLFISQDWLKSRLTAQPCNNGVVPNTNSASISHCTNLSNPIYSNLNLIQYIHIHIYI